MTAEAMQGIDPKADDTIDGGGRSALRLRRAVWVVLGLYLAPVALVVLLVTGLGMVCCAATKWLGGTGAETIRRDGHRIDGPASTVGTPHAATSRVRSPRR